MKSKATLYLTSSLLGISLLVTAITVIKLSENQTTVGTPAAASELKTPLPTASEIVEGFPDFPVYSNATLVTSDKETKPDGSVYYKTTWSVSGDNVIPEMISWYSDQLEKEGWQQVDESGDDGLMQARNYIKPMQSLSLNISKGDRESRYRISIAAELLISK